eukprot:2851787-Rhodomonas_salina.1
MPLPPKGATWGVGGSMVCSEEGVELPECEFTDCDCPVHEMPGAKPTAPATVEATVESTVCTVPVPGGGG